MANTETYTTYGLVTGDCGHSHKTHQSASQCLAKHARGCKSQGGYSDRAVYHDSEILRNAVGDVRVVESEGQYINAGFDRGSWD